MKKSLKKFALLSAGMFTLTALAPTVFAEDNSDDNNIEVEVVEDTEESELQTTLKEAIAIFLETFPDAEIEEIDVELGNDDNYKIDIDGFDSDNEYQLEFRTSPLEVIEEERESDDDDEVALDLEALISIDEASKIALTEAGFGVITSWNLDHDDEDGFHWDIEIDDRDSDREAEIKINAENGDIIETELDD